jgi:hypothetical protein
MSRVISSYEELTQTLNPIEILQKESLNWRITDQLIRKIVKRINLGKDRANTLGRIGEINARYHISRTLHKYGYRWSSKLKPMTYQIQHLYRGYRGIDFYVVVMDVNSMTWKLMIEVSNWASYRIDYFYRTRVKEKFTRYDRYNRCYHLWIVNRRNASRVIEEAKRDKIILLPVVEHITPDFINRRYKANDIEQETIW